MIKYPIDKPPDVQSMDQTYGRHRDLVDRYEISISKMTIDLSFFHLSLPIPLPDLIVYMSNTMGVQGRIQVGTHPARALPPKIGKKYDFFGVKSRFFTRITPTIFEFNIK
jgi:hypothetical protein